MSETKSLNTQFVDIHYKLYPEFNTPHTAVTIENIYLFGNVIEFDMSLASKAEKIVFDHHVKLGDLKSHVTEREPLENEGIDWEGYARQGNESNLE